MGRETKWEKREAEEAAGRVSYPGNTTSPVQPLRSDCEGATESQVLEEGDLAWGECFRCGRRGDVTLHDLNRRGYIFCSSCRELMRAVAAMESVVESGTKRNSRT